MLHLKKSTSRSNHCLNLISVDDSNHLEIGSFTKRLLSFFLQSLFSLRFFSLSFLFFSSSKAFSSESASSFSSCLSLFRMFVASSSNFVSNLLRNAFRYILITLYLISGCFLSLLYSSEGSLWLSLVHKSPKSTNYNIHIEH